MWSMGKASRDDVKKVFLSKKQPQDMLGKDSPGFAYEPRRQRELPSWGFGTALARPPPKKGQPETYNDLIGNIPDNQVFKYHQSGIKFGSLMRGACSNAPDIEGYPMGRISPGPARYNTDKVPPAVRHAHAPEVDQIAPKYTMRIRTKIMEAASQTPAKIGPGYYPAVEACTDQVESRKLTYPHWKAYRHDRMLGDPKKVRDSRDLWDGFGDQKEANSRTFDKSPSFGFGTSTRAHGKKITMCFQKADKGPAAFMDKPWASQPQLPAQRDVMKLSGIPTGV